jgi:hypothetical protein
LFLPLFLALTSCAGVSREAVLKEIALHPREGAYIEGVPIYPQKDNMCGPAALATLINFWGGPEVSQQSIASEAYLEKLKGTLPMDLFLYAKSAGFEVSYYKGSMDDLRKKISEGKPLILFLNLGIESYAIGHYIVAVGYGEKARAVIAHTGSDREETMSYDALERAWSLTGYSTLLVEPKAVR